MTGHLCRCAVSAWLMAGVVSVVLCVWFSHPWQPLLFDWLCMLKTFAMLIFLEWIFRRSGVSTPYS